VVARHVVFIDGMHGTTGLQIFDEIEPYAARIEVLRIEDAKRKDVRERERLLNEAEVVILCLPDDAARASVALIQNPRTRVLDASSAHRVAPGWVYGLPELTPAQSQAIAEARRVSNPGCYPTGATLLLRPLVRSGVAKAEAQYVVSAISGYSGGGRSMIEQFEADGPSRITAPVLRYGMFEEHKHVKEMVAYSGLTRAPVFMPSIGRYRQGILLQIPLLDDARGTQATAEEIRDLYRAAYEGHRHIVVLDAAQTLGRQQIDPTMYNGTNTLEISVLENPGLGQVVLSAVYDNLGKGASRAAVQNLKLMLGMSDHASGG
jgi:N-acetyl-gamma-glutamyl-phosphate reductase